MEKLTYQQWLRANRKALKQGYTRGRNACQLAGATFDEWCQKLYFAYVEYA